MQVPLISALTLDEISWKIQKEQGSRRERLWRIIFEAETPLGKAFDIILL